MVWNYISGQFIDVIEWLSDDRETLVYRFDRHGNEIKYGAKLTVREGQSAVFVHEGQLADVFTPGLYQLETNNMPVMTTLQHWDHGFKSPFKSEIYFVATHRVTDLKWGTKNPIMLRDPEFGPVRLRAFGSYSIRVKDPARFLVEIVGTDGHFTTDEISYQIRNIIVQETSRSLAASKIPVLDMASNTRELGTIIAEEIAPKITAYGLEIPELYIENISLPPQVESAMDKRSAMGVIGDLGRYRDFQTSEAMMAAAQNTAPGGNAMGAGIGMGMGIAMAQSYNAQPVQQGPWGPVQTQAAAPTAPPPPPPVEHVWHIAEDGKTHGPYSKARMGRMAQEASLTRETLVWTAGQDGWKPAGDIAELAQLFTVLPPPPPPA